MLKCLSQTLLYAFDVTIGDDADAADDVNHTHPIPNEESGRLTHTGPEVKF